MLIGAGSACKAESANMQDSMEMMQRAYGMSPDDM